MKLKMTCIWSECYRKERSSRIVNKKVIVESAQEWIYSSAFPFFIIKMKKFRSKYIFGTVNSKIFYYEKRQITVLLINGIYGLNSCYCLKIIVKLITQWYFN